MRIEDGTEPMKIPLLGFKPLIGVIHLPPTPSSPRGYGNIDRIVDYVVNEVDKLEEAGFDAAIIENYGDKPFSVEAYDEILAAVLSVVVREAVKSTKLPVGINVLRNNARLALAIAYATGAKFVRINAYCETRLSPEGVLMPLARDIEQIRKQLDRNILVLADIDVKHSYPIGQHSIGIVVNDCVERGYMDAIIASGQATTRPPEPGYVAFIKRNSPKPVLLGSGLRVDNIQLYWNIVDGFIVGSSIKYEGRTSNSIDPQKARELAIVVDELRRRTLNV
ncbi:MAG TPA: BtpA/SgcQ family protein [Pyrodictium delaneyi]|uniref:BtpA/SgcQ family protein n=1 Tax=Pyrodictium delaneyi TaxID=1273541 RepID=A0A832ZTX2_9CREN|nr:BtpA/SgcQ family protein [Pyrodictium delaneyi]